MRRREIAVVGGSGGKRQRRRAQTLWATVGVALAVVVSATPAYAYVCGNGILEPGEQCDVAQTTSGNDACDGCSHDCVLDEECGTALCADGVDNDADGVTDSDDAKCTTFGSTQALAALGVGATYPAVAFLKENRVRVQAGSGGSSEPFPYGPSRGEVCALSVLVGTDAALDTSVSALGRAQFSHSSPAGIAQELVVTAPDQLRVDRAEPWVGTPLGTCSLSAASCLSALDCGMDEETCDGRIGLSGNTSVDLTGTGSGSDNLARCQGGIDAVEELSAGVEALGLGGSDPLLVVGGESRVVSVNPGLNLLTYGSVHLGKQARLILDGPVDAVVVIQVRERFKLWSGSRVEVAGGLQARNVLWRFTNAAVKDIHLGVGSESVGTMLAPYRRIKILSDARITGAILARAVRFAKRSTLQHVPFTGLLPADLTLEATAPSQVAAGSSFAYEARIANPSFSAAAATTATFVLDADLSFISATASQGSCVHDGSASGGTVKCFVGHVAAAASPGSNEVTVSLALATSPSMVASQTVAASVAHSLAEPHADNNTVNLEIAP